MSQGFCKANLNFVIHLMRLGGALESKGTLFRERGRERPLQSFHLSLASSSRAPWAGFVGKLKPS